MWTLSMPWWVWLSPFFLMALGGAAGMVIVDVAEWRLGERRPWMFMVPRILALGVVAGGIGLLMTAVFG